LVIDYFPKKQSLEETRIDLEIENGMCLVYNWLLLPFGNQHGKRISSIYILIIFALKLKYPFAVNV
jgi:hypothetical protein